VNLCELSARKCGAVTLPAALRDEGTHTLAY
jgi:hypothetical protein